MLNYIAKKSFSTDNLLNQLFKTHCKMGNKPMFVLNSGQIQILKNPIDFYIELNVNHLMIKKKGIQLSQKRIIWNSLYLGEGNLEKFLVERLTNHVFKYDQIKLSILLDYYRGTRTEPNKPENSLSLLKYIKRANLLNHNIKFGFMRHPKLPQIFNMFHEGGEREIFNVHHMKWYIFDNKVIFTGANLQQSYFLDRQDRYMIVHDAEQLTDFLDDAQAALMQHSFQINDEVDLQFPSNYDKPYKSKKYFNQFLQTWKMFEFAHQHDDQELEQIVAQDEDQDINDDDRPLAQSMHDSNDQTKKQDIPDDIHLDEQNLEIIKKEQELIQRLQERKEEAKKILESSFSEWDVQNIVTKLEKSLYRQEDQRNSQSGSDVFLFITFQIPFLQTNSEALLFDQLIYYLDQHPEQNLKFTSGYMNFDKKTTSSLLKLKNQVELLCAGPRANGFFKAGRVKSFIPYFYRWYEMEILRRSSNNISINEYNRPGWTYHAKGLWLKIKDDSFFTLIGSSNYSERSQKRDNEVQIYLYSKCPDLNKELQEEYENLFSSSEKVTKESILSDPETKLTLTSRLLSKIFKTFL